FLIWLSLPPSLYRACISSKVRISIAEALEEDPSPNSISPSLAAPPQSRKLRVLTSRIRETTREDLAHRPVFFLFFNRTRGFRGTTESAIVVLGPSERASTKSDDETGIDKLQVTTSTSSSWLKPRLLFLTVFVSVDEGREVVISSAPVENLEASSLPSDRDDIAPGTKSGENP
ncbi:hypothetical protein Dimus_017587, partial [Dionaea muscipula]